MAIDKFDFFTEIDRQCLFIGVFGSKQCGKTTLVKNILFQQKQTRQNHTIHTFSDNVDQLSLHKIWLDQKMSNSSTCTIVFDTALSPALWKSDIMKNIMYKGRHYGIECIFTEECISNIPITFRFQFNYIFLFKCGNPKRAYDCFFSSFFPTLDEFVRIYYQYTTNYSTLVVSLDDVFWFKAERLFDEKLTLHDLLKSNNLLI